MFHICSLLSSRERRKKLILIEISLFGQQDKDQSSIQSSLKPRAFCIVHIWCSRKWGKWRKSSIKNKNPVNLLNKWCRNYRMWINKIKLHVFSACAGSNCWLQYRLNFSKPVKFYGVNIAQFMPKIHKNVFGTKLHKRPILPHHSYWQSYECFLQLN